ARVKRDLPLDHGGFDPVRPGDAHRPEDGGRATVQPVAHRGGVALDVDLGGAGELDPREAVLAIPGAEVGVGPLVAFLLEDLVTRDRQGPGPGGPPPWGD